MSMDPALAIQGAIVTRLKAAATAAANNVFDAVPPSNPFPRITVGEHQSIRNAADCYDGTESFITLHVWSTVLGMVQAKTIADQVREALEDLDQSDMPLAGHTLALLHFESSQALRDPDGITSHIVMTFRALSQPST